jgi:hypothetical protein
LSFRKTIVGSPFLGAVSGKLDGKLAQDLQARIHRSMVLRIDNPSSDEGITIWASKHYIY